MVAETYYALIDVDRGLTNNEVEEKYGKNSHTRNYYFRSGWEVSYNGHKFLKPC